MRSICFALIFINILLAGCNNKPKPVSANFNKTSVMLNGKKDSVLNNTQKNYSNATIAEPCIKCIIGIIQKDSLFKKKVTLLPQKNILYSVNWIKYAEPDNTIPARKGTNGLRVDVLDKGKNNSKLVSYIYDNSSSLLFYGSTATVKKIKVSISPAELTRIRNSCYWGVASK